MFLTFFIIAVILGLIAEIFKIEKLFPESFKAKPWILVGLLITAAIFTFLYEYFKEPETKTTINYQPTFNSPVVGKDSSKGKTTTVIRQPVIQRYSPNINFTLTDAIVIDSFTNNYIKITVNIESSNAPSIVKDATIYMLSTENQSDNFFKDLRYDNKEFFLLKDLGIKENYVWYERFEKEGSNLKRLKKIYVLIKGSYTDSNRKNLQTFDKVGFLDLVSKKSGLVPRPYDDSVRIFLKKKGIIKKL